MRKGWAIPKNFDSLISPVILYCIELLGKKVQVGKDQEKAQSEKDSHSKNKVDLSLKDSDPYEYLQIQCSALTFWGTNAFFK